MSTRAPSLGRRRVLTPAAAGGLAAAVWSAPADAASSGDVLRLSRREMAADVEICLPVSANAEAALRALDEIGDLARRFTAFDPGSEVGALNRDAARGPVRVAPDLFALLQRATALSAATGGAFDVTAGALWRAWGFMGGDPAEPSTFLAGAQSCAGAAHLLLDPAASSVAFARPGLEVNLGAIGKGYAIDCAVAALASAGERRALLHAGFSSVRAVGDAPGAAAGSGWRVTIRHPDRRGRPLAALALRDRAMGVTGTAERFVERDGRRVGHVLDPRTGRPARHHALAVAWTDEATSSDALSTAFFVLTAREVEDYCARHAGVGALLLPSGEAGGGAVTFGAVPAGLEVEVQA